MARDRVCVCPGMLPAIIRVAPNSHRARANARNTPAKIPGIAKGSVTLKKVATALTPKICAPFSRAGSTPSKAARAAFSTMRKATTVAATTAPCQVNGSTSPQSSSEEHTAELQYLLRRPYADFCLHKNSRDQLEHSLDYYLLLFGI